MAAAPDGRANRALWASRPQDSCTNAARRQAPRNGASILDSAKELGIRDAQVDETSLDFKNMLIFEDHQITGGLGLCRASALKRMVFSFSWLGTSL